LLPKAIRRKIADNYRPIGSGDILVPGFSLKANQEKEEKVWIAGTYYVSDANVMIDGKYPKDNSAINMGNSKYFIQNLNSQPVVFLYLFSPSEKNVTKATFNTNKVNGNV